MVYYFKRIIIFLASSSQNLFEEFIDYFLKINIIFK